MVHVFALMDRCALRRAERRLALLACLTSVLPVGLAAQRPYRIGPPPHWVRPIPVARAAPATPRAVSEGYELLLVDRQEAIVGRTVERFRHVAYRLLNEGAVQEHSQVEIVFDSTYEQLTLHEVTVTRGGRSIDQLYPNRIRVVQRESRLDYQIYDGSLSLVLLLEDVRRGDVVEYSFTRRGANPVFAGHFMRAVLLQETVPLHRTEFRLLWPRNRRLFVTRRQTQLEPAVRDLGPYREYIWRDTLVPPKVLDPDRPSWYDAFPEIQLSDFASWPQVAAWGDTLFASPDQLPTELAPSLTAIRSRYASTQARALAALRFVQEEVRYLGVEIGVNSHRPYTPAIVMRRRYGDCKDKVLLLVTMLRALGVEAQPALVSTDYDEHVRDFHPTATIFDHAIVRAVIDGRAFWLDPTDLYQGGNLASASPPFGVALVLDPHADSLSAIPEPTSAEPFTDIAVSFAVPDVGKPADMRIDTRYMGRAANEMRASIRSTSIDELGQRYTDFYADAYPAVRSRARPEIQDDDAANMVRTVERYSIPEFWHDSQDQGDRVGTFQALELARAIPATTASARSMPLAVTHPVHLRYRLRATSWNGWSIAPRDETIETPAVRFTYRVRAQGEVLTLGYEYQTLADHVAPEAAAAHFNKLSRIRKLLTFVVTPPGRAATLADGLKPEQVNWAILLTVLVAFGAALAAARRYALAPAPAWPRGPTHAETGPEGLRGWLVVLAIAICIAPARLFMTILRTAPTYTESSWTRLTLPGGGAYDARWAPVLLFELVANVALLVFACLQVWLFFQRRRSFPALFVVFAIAGVTMEWLDLAFLSLIPSAPPPKDWSRHVYALIGTALWVSYVFRSRRVRNTFVRASRSETTEAAPH